MIERAGARWRGIYLTVAGNLAVFIALTASPAFQRLHHHWIFPILASVFAIEWALLGGRAPARWAPYISLGAARQTTLTLLAFLICMGIVRHETILACVGRCSFKLAGAAVIVGIVFSIQSHWNESFWDRGASQLVALGCLIWSGFLVLYGLQVPPRSLDALFLAAAVLLLALGPRRPAFRAVEFGIPFALVVRRAFGEYGIIAIDLTLVLFALGFVKSHRSR